MIAASRKPDMSPVDRIVGPTGLHMLHAVVAMMQMSHLLA